MLLLVCDWELKSWMALGGHQPGHQQYCHRAVCNSEGTPPPSTRPQQSSANKTTSYSLVDMTSDKLMSR